MRIKAELLKQPLSIEEQIERDIYNQEGIVSDSENDEIDLFEEGFMQGYLEADAY